MRYAASIILSLGLGVSSVAATAMPVVDLTSDSVVTRVAYGCGLGWTRGPAGFCRPRYTCPRGWHSGPYGYHCFRNW